MFRGRRLRTSETLRDLVRENHVSVRDLICPLFVTAASSVPVPVPSMPGIFQWTLDALEQEVERIFSLGIRSILLFGIPSKKDPDGSESRDDNGVVQRAIRLIKQKYPSMLVIADVCLCEYTDHGHCGLVHEGKVLNDETLPLLAASAVSFVRAGADVVAPSDMMDGRVAAIRSALDSAGYSETPILSYSAKFASAYYGPFREAAQSAPTFGDRRTYQMDPANSREALREVSADIAEGADMIIAKPALAYLDVLAATANRFDVPVIAYNVSGEYSMVKAAAEKGWIDERRIVSENLLAMKRAGARAIITYHAADYALWQKG